MTFQSHTLLLEAGLSGGCNAFQAGGALTPEQGPVLAGSTRWSVRWGTLQAGSSAGVQVVEINNGLITAVILPTRGMGLWKLVTEQREIGWNSPVPRPVHPHFVNLKERGGLGWLNGFNELLCRCGLGFMGPPCQDAGQDVTLHGRIANLPAHEVRLEIETSGPGAIALIGITDETTMFGPCLRLKTTYRLEAGSSTVHVHDEIENLGGQPAPIGLLYHINVGAPLLGEGSVACIPHAELAPRDAVAVPGVENYARYDGPVAGFAEQAFYFRPLADSSGWATTALVAPDAQGAIGVRFRPDQLPWFVQWKNTVAAVDGYVTGLEPALNLPNPWTRERPSGRLKVLQPGERWSGQLQLVVAEQPTAVQQLQEQVRHCQGDVSPQVHPQPHPEWS